jgi:hypothetical protein
MVTLPADTPVTVPVVDPMLANVLLLLVHVPGLDASVSVEVRPTHTFVVPPIAAGNAFTVIGVVTEQPVGIVYIILGVPADTPVTMPDEAPAVACPGLLLVHVPPTVASLSVVVWPTQTTGVPVVATGVWLTV